jgi:leucyl-tRNA synthetase
MDFKETEKKWQKRWKDSGVFAPNVNKKQKKFFFTTPYPYISGSLHIGHGRAVTESDIYVRYMRMKGYNVLYPLAFHITGTPVLGISAAIENGDKKKIEIYKNYVKNYISENREVEKIVKSFKDPWNIVNFFIPKMMDEYSSLGLSVDWSRRFTTGDPDYQKFITWQFMKYRDKKYLIKGSYPVLFCPNCGNAVGEDDIQDADTNPVTKQDFIWGKFRLKGSDLILMAGTTRPDAFYGQTNLWIDPDATYKIVKVNKEKWVVGNEAVKKIESQHGKPEVIGEIKASELMGKWVKGPLVDDYTYVLPANFIDANVGSGIVFSALEDPVDLLELKKLQTDPKAVKKYNLDEKVVAKLKPIYIINVPEMGENLGEDIAKEFGVGSYKDIKKLEEAKNELNKRVFRKGVMKNNCGKCAGKTVPDAQVYLKKSLVKSGDAAMFYEVSREAFCRCGGKVTISILKDQWFLDFNASGWKDLAYKCLREMEFLPETSRKLFEDTFEWLDKRPAARKRGLGTPLPFDSKWIIESLSDSTIYMSFYTIKNLISKHKVKPDQMVPEFFDYVYLGKGIPKQVSKKTRITGKVLKEMRESFDYWYPNDHRHTYMAHLSNHLSFFIFAHAGLFPKKYWPGKISLHGFVTSDGIKMSKSKGNVISLLDVKNNYGADTFRAYISTATSLDGAFNWRKEEALVMKKRLSSVHGTISDMVRKMEKGKLSSHGKSFISRFESYVKEADDALSKMRLRHYGNIVIYHIPSALKRVQKRVSGEEEKAIYEMVADKWIRMLNPVVPHLSEDLWEKLGKKRFASLESWPNANEKLIDPRLKMMDNLIESTKDDIVEIIKLVGKSPKGIRIYTAPGWKHSVYKAIMKEFKGKKQQDIIKNLMKIPEVRGQGRHAIRFADKLSKIPKLTDMPSEKEEFQALTEAKRFLEKEFGCTIEVIEGYKSTSEKALRAEPGKPGIEIIT